MIPFQVVQSLLDLRDPSPVLLRGGTVFDVREFSISMGHDPDKVVTPWTYLVSDGTGLYVEVPLHFGDHKARGLVGYPPIFCGFHTRDEAAEYRDQQLRLFELHSSKYLYVITGGRQYGLFCGLFSQGKLAVEKILVDLVKFHPDQEFAVRYNHDGQGRLLGSYRTNNYEIKRVIPDTEV
ncbi:MAG TPA: hypothetical protein VN843_11555 [Anaerolineales bacterium]|nr:hypothetical protein [Anaerolineales bacterium]